MLLYLYFYNDYYLLSQFVLTYHRVNYLIRKCDYKRYYRQRLNEEYSAIGLHVTDNVHDYVLFILPSIIIILPSITYNGRFWVRFLLGPYQ